MSGKSESRRNFLGAAVAAPTLGMAVLADPARAAAQAVVVKRADLPDLTIKQVRVLVLKAEARRPPANGPALAGAGRRGGGRGGPPGERPGEKFASIVTNSG